MKIKLSSKEIYETDDYTFEQLKEFQSTLFERLDTIDAKIQTAKSNAYLKQEYADPDWWNRINFARKRYLRAIEELKPEVARRRRIEEAGSKIGVNMQDELPKHFLRAARDLLPREVYTQILQAAVDRYAASQSGHQREVYAMFEHDKAQGGTLYG